MKFGVGVRSDDVASKADLLANLQILLGQDYAMLASSLVGACTRMLSTIYRTPWSVARAS